MCSHCVVEKVGQTWLCWVHILICIMISHALVCKIHTGIPNCWTFWLWIRQLSDPLLSVWPFLPWHTQKVFGFFPFLLNLYQILFWKTKTVENWSFEWFRDPQKFLFEPLCYQILYNFPQTYRWWVIYRETQETGDHRFVLQTLVGTVGSGMNKCCRSWHYLSFNVLIDWSLCLLTLKHLVSLQVVLVPQSSSRWGRSVHYIR